MTKPERVQCVECGEWFHRSSSGIVTCSQKCDNAVPGCPYCGKDKLRVFVGHDDKDRPTPHAIYWCNTPHMLSSPGCGYSEAKTISKAPPFPLPFIMLNERRRS